jgi:hypothetical protein
MGTSANPMVPIRCPLCGQEFDVRRDSPEFARDPFYCTRCVPLQANNEC